MTFQLTGVAALASPQSVVDCAGGNITAIRFSPYGSPSASGTAAWLPGFNGERRDPLTGTTHLGNGYRAYNPALMRFHAPDSLSPFGAGGINPYAYCAGDPVNNSDPSGHMSSTDIGSIVLGTVGLILSVVTLGMSIAAVSALEIATFTGEEIVIGGVEAANDITTAISAGTSTLTETIDSSDAFQLTSVKKSNLAYKKKIMSKKIAGVIPDFMASSTGISSAVEHDKGDLFSAKILGALSLTFFALSVPVSAREIYNLSRHNVYGKNKPRVHLLEMGATTGAMIAGFIHEGIALNDYFSDDEVANYNITKGSSEIPGVYFYSDSLSRGEIISATAKYKSALLCKRQESVSWYQSVWVVHRFCSFTR